MTIQYVQKYNYVIRQIAQIPGIHQLKAPSAVFNSQHYVLYLTIKHEV